MRGRFLGLRYSLYILLVSPFVLCTHQSWAQQMPPLGEGPVLISDRAPQLGQTPEAGTALRPVFVLPENFATNKGETEWRVTLPPLLASNDRVPTNSRALVQLRQPTAGPSGKGKYFTRSTSNEWVTPSHSKAPSSLVHHSIDLQHRIPGAGPIILRVSQQAQAHPHVTGVLKLLKPQF